MAALYHGKYTDFPGKFLDHKLDAIQYLQYSVFFSCMTTYMLADMFLTIITVRLLTFLWDPV
jgi:hypothetical protein